MNSVSAMMEWKSEGRAEGFAEGMATGMQEARRSVRNLRPLALEGEKLPGALRYLTRQISSTVALMRRSTGNAWRFGRGLHRRG